MASRAASDTHDCYFVVPDEPTVTLRYRVLNRTAVGRPLVMVMGLGSLLDDWAEADTKLAYELGHRPVLVFDNRGVGGSSLNRSHLTVHRMASDALALAFHVFGASCYFHVFGVSMGGTSRAVFTSVVYGLFWGVCFRDDRPRVSAAERRPRQRRQVSCVGCVGVHAAWRRKRHPTW
jgi:hypothetical protein